MPVQKVEMGDLVEIVLDRLSNRGGDQRMTLLRALSEEVSAGRGVATAEDVVELLASCDVRLTPDQADVPSMALDPNGTGGLPLQALLDALRGSLPDCRRDIVDEAWQRLDPHGNGVVDLHEDCLDIYKSGLAENPLVVSGQKTRAQVIRGFIATWERNADGKITRQDFDDYYTELSPQIDDDHFFESQIRQFWKLEPGIPLPSHSQPLHHTNHSKQPYRLRAAAASQTDASQSASLGLLDTNAGLMKRPSSDGPPAPPKITGYTGFVPGQQETLGLHFQDSIAAGMANHLARCKPPASTTAPPPEAIVVTQRFSKKRAAPRGGDVPLRLM